MARGWKYLNYFLPNAREEAYLSFYIRKGGCVFSKTSNDLAWTCILKNTMKASWTNAK